MFSLKISRCGYVVVEFCFGCRIRTSKPGPTHLEKWTTRAKAELKNLDLRSKCQQEISNPFLSTVGSNIDSTQISKDKKHSTNDFPDINACFHSAWVQGRRRGTASGLLEVKFSMAFFEAEMLHHPLNIVSIVTHLRFVLVHLKSPRHLGSPAALPLSAAAAKQHLPWSRIVTQIHKESHDGLASSSKTW